MLRKPKVWLTIVIVDVLLAAVIWTLIFRSEIPKGYAVQPVSVEVTAATQQTIPVSIDALGSLSAVHEVDVSPEVNGQVAKIEFTNGQSVQKDKVLFQLDDSVAQAQLSAAEAKFHLSQSDFKRNRRLLAHDALSEQALDKAKEIMAENKAMMKEKKLLVEQMRLVAPFSGTLGSRTVSQGQYVAVGQTLVKLVDTSTLKVVYSVPETYLSQLKLGQVVEISSDALPGESFSGVVSYVSPSIDVTTRSVEVHASVPNNADQLALGMFVKVTQELSERPDAIVVPAEALVATITGSEVYTIDDGRAVETSVKIGARWQNNVEITSGLTKGQQVIVAGQQKLRDGTPVQVIASNGKQS